MPYRISAFTGFPTLYNMMLIYDTNKDVKKSVTKKIKISAAYGMDEISSAYELGYQYNLFKFVYGRKVWSDLEEFEYNYLGLLYSNESDNFLFESGLVWGDNEIYEGAQFAFKIGVISN